MTAGDLWELLREAELVRDIAWVLTNADERRGCEELLRHWRMAEDAAFKRGRKCEW